MCCRPRLLHAYNLMRGTCVATRLSPSRRCRSTKQLSPQILSILPTARVPGIQGESLLTATPPSPSLPRSPGTTCSQFGIRNCSYFSDKGHLCTYERWMLSFVQKMVQENPCPVVSREPWMSCCAFFLSCFLSHSKSFPFLVTRVRGVEEPTHLPSVQHAPDNLVSRIGS